MKTDSHGLALSTVSDTAIRHYNTFVTEQLSYGADPGIIFKAVAADPESAFLNAVAANIHMSLEAAEGYRAAAPFVKSAIEGAARASMSDREARYIEGMAAYARQDSAAAAAILTELARDYPTDISSAKWAQLHHFNLGNASGMRAAVEAILPALDGRPFVHGMEAFALEQTGDFRGAEAAARRAIEILDEDAWAHHALAHVMEMEGRVEEGETFMRGHSAQWQPLSVFIREHNWWHIALFLLDQERHDEALAIYDDHLWGEWPQFCQEQIGAVSALWRMELRGIDVGSRWQAPGEEIAKREFEHLQPFHDLHYIFGLARSGRQDMVKEFLASMKTAAASFEDTRGTLWHDLCYPLASGIAAFASGDFEAAFTAIDPLIPRLHLIGGSHAQRDLFVQTWIEAMLKTGRLNAAREVLEARAAARPLVETARKQLARAI